MRVHLGLDAVPRMPGAVLTMGTFDGVHLGHQAVIGETVRLAAGLPSVLLTYDPHPRQVVRGEGPPLLTTVDEKIAVIEATGVTDVVVVPFTREIAAWSAERFVEDVLVRRIGVRDVVLGHDHRFGARGAGDATLLRQLGAVHGFGVDVLPPQEIGGQIVSSSVVRALLVGGDVTEAARLLGRPYTLSGTVVHGDQIGRTLGYPTANLDPDTDKLVPGHGIYAVRARTADGAVHNGLVSLGTRPTFDGRDVRVEAHLFDYDGDLYGQRLGLAFVRFLRHEQRFDSAEALVRQMDEDAVIGRRVLDSVS